MQLVILDRDGVISVDAGASVPSEHEWQAVPGSLEALVRLSGAGYRLVVACNEPGQRQKTSDVEALVSVHHGMQHELHEAGGRLDAVFFCICPPKEECDCMMPKPGLLLEIAERLRTSLEGVPVIGCSIAAIEAARAAGARPIYVRSGARNDTELGGLSEEFECYDDLAAAVDTLLAETAQA